MCRGVAKKDIRINHFIFVYLEEEIMMITSSIPHCLTPPSSQLLGNQSVTWLQVGYQLPSGATGFGNIHLHQVVLSDKWVHKPR